MHDDGAFNGKAIKSYLLKLLSTEIIKAESMRNALDKQLYVYRRPRVAGLSDLMLMSIFVLIRMECQRQLSKQEETHQKLRQLSKAQAKPPRSTERIVVLNNGVKLPNVVKKLLPVAPKHHVLRKFYPNSFLADMENT